MSTRRRTQEVGHTTAQWFVARWTSNHPFLPVTACRVETPVTQRKQRIGVNSTRHWNGGVSERAKSLFRAENFRALLLLALVAILAGAATPAPASPRQAKSLTVERIYGAPSLNGHLT